METKFQTSFIPKKPILSQTTVRTHRTISLFALFSILLFIISLAGAGFVIVWKNVLLKTQTQYEATLQANENQFNPALITTLSRASDKINVSQQLLASHLVVSQVFTIIGALTAQNISFSSLDYSAPTTPGGTAMIAMKGIGSSFSDIAFQSDVFGSAVQYGTNTKIVTPILSNLGLNQNGAVSFTFTAGINPSDILYSKSIQQ
jgi:hypothetical protein